MRFKFTFAFLVTLACINSIWACSCIGVQNFCESTLHNPNIALVKVVETSNNGYSFDVRIEERLSGNIVGENISINYYATSCTDFVNVEVGDELIINFNTLSDIGDAPYPSYDFFLCNVNFLRVENNNVIGMINKNESDKMNLGDFLSLLEECTNLSFVDPETSLISRSFRLINNPVNDILKVKTINIENLNFDLRIYNNCGELIYNDEQLEESNLTINTSSFPAGIYYCAFKVKNAVFTKPFIKI